MYPEFIRPEFVRPADVSIEEFNAFLEKNAKNTKKHFVKTDWCRGFSVVIKRSVIEKIGKVDEIYGLAYFDDVDYSVTAIEAGFLCLRALDTYVYHHRNVTFFEILKMGKWNELHEKNKLIYYKKWGKPLKLAIVLDKKICKNRHMLDKVEDTVFYLARKQHHIKIWCPEKLPDRFQYTNIKLKTYHPLLLRLILFFDLYMNKRKRLEKRYNAVLDYGKEKDAEKFNRFIIETVDNLKEKTKESINVNV